MTSQTANHGLTRSDVPAGSSRGRLPDATSASPIDQFEEEGLPHLNDMFRTAVRLLQDHDKACDAVQKTYLIAWKSFHRYEVGTNCRAWLFRVLFNVVRHERQSWFKWIRGRDGAMVTERLVAPTPIPTNLTDSSILTALDKLPVMFREVLLLVDVEEFAYKEASEILRVPIGTVMSRLSRGRALLRGQLADIAQSPTAFARN